MTDLAKALSAGWPGKSWSLDGNDYSGLRWLDSRPKPTEHEIEDAWIALNQPTPAEILAENRRQMALILDGLDVADRSFFMSSRLKVERALDAGDIELAVYVVTNQNLPGNREDLVAAKAAILALLPHS